METPEYIYRHLQSRNSEVRLIKYLFVEFPENLKSYSIKAYNQFLFLEVKQLQDRTMIYGDNNAFVQKAGVTKPLNTIEEFTGLVTIESMYRLDNNGTYIKDYLTGGLEFLQVFIK